MARTWRVSAYVEQSIGAQVYELSAARGCSITGLLEEALREYLAARPPGTTLPLAARLPRSAGRPSLVAEKAAAARETRMKKRTGRPLKARPTEITVE